MFTAYHINKIKLCVTKTLMEQLIKKTLKQNEYNKYFKQVTEKLIELKPMIKESLQQSSDGKKFTKLHEHLKANKIEALDLDPYYSSYCTNETIRIVSENYDTPSHELIMFRKPFIQLIRLICNNIINENTENTHTKEIPKKLEPIEIII